MSLFRYTYTTKRGSILIISMVMLSLFSILSLGMYKICNARINLAKKMDQLIISKQAAYSMCEVTLRDLQEDSSIYHTLYELRTPQLKTLGLAEIKYYFIDEESKLNVNQASKEQLERLDALDEKSARNINESILKPYSIKEEILLVEDLEQEEYDAIKDFITVYGEGEVNINTASEEVLLALGMDKSLVSDIITFRAGSDGQEITEDDNIFESTGEIIQALEDFCGLFKDDEDKLKELISGNLLDTRGANFLMHLDIKVKGRAAKNCDIIINEDGIAEWRED